jgi:prophage regulatory protein
MNATPPAHRRTLNLVTIGNVSEMVGVSRQRAWQLAGRQDFPPPAAVLSTGRVWQRDDIVQWIEDWERLPGRPPRRRRPA